MEIFQAGGHFQKRQQVAIPVLVYLSMQVLQKALPKGLLYSLQQKQQNS